MDHDEKVIRYAAGKLLLDRKGKKGTYSTEYDRNWAVKIEEVIQKVFDMTQMG